MKRTQTSIAKITSPKITGVYERKRLFKLLDHGLERPVVWISAPAGSGKTTLVGSYLAARKRPCLWYQMDEGDGDIATFFYYMGLAGKNAAPRVKHPLPLLTPEYIGGVPVFSRRYFENLCTRLKPPFSLIFDNYQTVPQDSLFHDVFREGLSGIPHGIEVIVISRSDPPPPFAGMLAGNKIHVLGWDELRLTPDESKGIVRLEGKVEASGKAIERMHERAQGWAAGLILLTKSAKTADIDLALFDKLAPEQVFDYFANELFDKADGTIRDFLLRTAFLPKITVPIAEKITGIHHAGRILSDLNRNNYFTEKRRHAEISYQYHPLFREFLLARAQTLLSQMEVSRIRMLAAELLEQSGQIEDAAELFIEVRDWKGLTHLVLDHAQALAAQGRSRTIESWITRIPREFTEANPWLLYWHGMSLLHYCPKDSAPLFERAFELFTTDEDAAGVFLSWSGVVDSILLQFDRFGRFDRWFDELQQALKKYKGFPSAEIESRVTLSMFSAIVLRIPHHPDAMKWRERMISLARQSRDVNLQVQATFQASWHELYVGHAKRAASILLLSEKIATADQTTPPTRIMTKMLSSVHHWVHGLNEQCQILVSEALQMAEASGVHVWDYQALGGGTTSALIAGDIERAEELLQRMEATLPQAPAMDASYYYFLSSWYAVIRRDFSAALESAKMGFDFSERLESPFPTAVNSLGAAVIYHALKNYEESARHYKRAWEIAAEMGSPALLFMCLLAEAQFAFDRRTESAGLHALRRALTIGREQGYVNMYWWRQDVMARLCAKALEHGIEVEYAQELVRKHNLSPDDACRVQPAESKEQRAKGKHHAPCSMPCAYQLENWPWPIRINTLGRFELLRDGKPVRSSGKVQKKPLEMLKALIALGGKEVQGEQIAAALWPDADGDAAYKAFGITLIRLRELLGEKNAVHLSEGNVTLDQRYFWIDTWAVEYLLEEAEEKHEGETGRRGDREKWRGSEKEKKSFSPLLPFADSPFHSFLERAISLYRGPFLGAESASWAISLRERLKDKFLRAVLALGASWEREGKIKKAVEQYLQGLAVDDLAEEFYQRLIVCYFKLGQRAEAVKMYRRCEKTLSAILGVSPSPATMAVYRKVQTEKS